MRKRGKQLGHGLCTFRNAIFMFSFVSFEITYVRSIKYNGQENRPQSIISSRSGGDSCYDGGDQTVSIAQSN